MFILEIVLIVIGLFAVIVSFLLSDRKEGQAGKLSELSAPEEEKGEKFLGEWEQQRDEMLQQASDELSRLSNDKILGMDEYSSQVLERISKNHEEVVFLYNMLKEKETEIQDLVHHVDSVKAQIYDKTAQEYQRTMEAIGELQEKRHLAGYDTDIPAQQPERSAADGPEMFSHDRTGRSRSERGGGMSWETTQAGHLAMSARDIRRQEGAGSVAEEEKAVPERQEGANHNEEIIDLYEKGHSILQISKLLSLGQGEVKFVIDLLKDR